MSDSVVTAELLALQLPKQGELPVKVYYEDTDSLGIVYYANYLKYFERGRSELFESAGLSLLDWNRAGYNVAVFKANITYHLPAKLGDQCIIRTKRLVARTPFRMPLQQECWRGEELLVEAKIQLVCLDEALQLREFPDNWIAVGASIGEVDGKA